MTNFFRQIRSALDRGEQVVLCTIVAASGSVPRGAGAKMAVFADGSTIGSVGGGAVERAAVEQAMQTHRTGCAGSSAYCLTPNEVRDIGMICGGEVTVRFEPLTRRSVTLIDAILEQLAACKNAWLVLCMTEDNSQTGLYDEENGLRFLDDGLLQLVKPLCKKTAVYQKGSPELYIEPVSRRGRVWIFGAGHVGRALVPVLAGVGFRVAVYDNRPDFASAQAHPMAERVVLGDYADAAEKAGLTADDYVVIMTPGHQADRELLLQLLPLKTSYIGCIGSRRKVAATRQYLLENGISEEDIARIHSPIGLSIGAQTPEEIAISIAAQLIAHRAQI